MDILGLAMNDGAELRVHPTGKAVLGISARARARATRRRSPRSSPRSSASRPRTSRSSTATPTARPYGLGTYGSRSTPVSGAATALVARKVRERARLIAAGDARGAPPTTSSGRRAAGSSRATPTQGKTIQEIAMAAHGAGDLPEGVEGGAGGHRVYNPPNLTFPFGAYICVVDVDPGTGEVKVRRFIAVDDCGVADQPDDRRGPDPRRPGRGRRHRADGADRVRRAGQLPGRRRSWTT